MALNVVITSQPAVEPLTLPEIREHARVDWTVEDNWLQNALVTARQWLEGILGRALITQTIRATFDLPTRNSARGAISGYIGRTPAIAFELPYAAPLQAISAVEIEKDVASWQALTLATHYVVDSDATPARVWLRMGSFFYWAPSLDLSATQPRVRVTYTAGYGDHPNDVPYQARQALLNAIGYLYANRDCGGNIPDDLAPMRLMVIQL
jgi:uncharacterized phiE125 gp8 family phage protein